MQAAASMRRVAGTGTFETYMDTKAKLCSCSYKINDSMESVPISCYGFEAGEETCQKCHKKVTIIVDSRDRVRAGVE
jgi:hypothetical protein